MNAAVPRGHGQPEARILVVDDELGIREGCRKILAAEGYEVVTAGDGKAGLEQFLERGPFAVLLVDLQMPRMSGLELMREARGRDPDIVPIIITAHATIDTAVAFMPRSALVGYVRRTEGLALCGRGAACPG